eukprot:126767_1
METSIASQEYELDLQIESEATLPLKNGIRSNINIASKMNIHCCKVYEFLADIDIPYEIPIEIIALITKFYLHKSNESINNTINPEIRNSIPRTCSLDNPIPTIQIQSTLTSWNSLFNWYQFFCDLFIWGATYIVCIISNKIEPALAIFIGCLLFVTYCGHIYIHWNDINRIICLPLKYGSNRIFSLNYIFDSTPQITFSIHAHHDDSKTNVVTFRKKRRLKLNNCDTVIKSNC